MIVKLYNNQATEDVWIGITVSENSYSDPLSDSDIALLRGNSKVNQDIWSDPIKLIINDGTNDLTPAEGSEWIKGNYLHIIETPPFAAPLYRTKNDATSSIVEVSANSNEDVDFQITSEIYTSGGRLLVENAEFGDYITAEIHDKDEVIPEAYREALCEDHPTVAAYITKQWVCPSGGCEIDTRPLNAKITAGLYLRITYYAIDSGSTRNVAINYDLQKKL